MKQPLEDRVIAVPEVRAADILSRMLEERGARALRVPLVGIRDAPDREVVEAWIARFIAGRCDDLVLYTGEGLGRLVAFADRLGCAAPFVSSLGKVRKITRGPKPVRALREVGLDTDLRADEPTTAGLLHALSALELRGRTVGLQLYPNPHVEPLLALLGEAGAEVDPVSPYIYVPAAEAVDVVRLIEQLDAGAVDGIAFTSASQVARLVEVAKAARLEEALARGLDRCLVAAIGPVVVEELQRHGRQAALVAPEPYALKPMVRAIEARFAAAEGHAV